MKFLLAVVFVLGLVCSEACGYVDEDVYVISVTNSNKTLDAGTATVVKDGGFTKHHEKCDDEHSCKNKERED